jgi:hypothetical protein
MGEIEEEVTPEGGVIPAKAGIQFFILRFAWLDSVVRRNDDGAIFPRKSIDKGESLG